MSPSSGVSIREIAVGDGNAGPYGITMGPDDALWVTMVHAGQIVRLTLDGHVDRYQLDPASCRPSVITSGPDDALWYTQTQAGAIGRMSIAGDAESFPVTAADSAPFGITLGPDGALWFTQISADRIGRVTTTGQVTEFALPVQGWDAVDDHCRSRRGIVVHPEPDQRDRADRPRR